jgi:hypothetical protein
MLELLDFPGKGGSEPAGSGSEDAATGASPAFAGDAASALAELVLRLESDAGTHDREARAGAISQLQDRGAAPFAALLAQYLSDATATHAAREVMLKSLLQYQARLAQALCQAAGAALTPASAARALRALRALAKLHLLHYASVPDKLWGVACAIHANAEKSGFATTQVHAQADPHATTTVEQELLRLLMLGVSAPDMLAPEQIEVADRVVEQLGAEFTLRQPGVADNPFCYEPAGEVAPRRASGKEQSAATRHFGPGMGYDSLERVVRQLGAAKREDFKAFGKDIPPRVQLGAARHLLAFWGTELPIAPPTHSPASGALRVVHGYGPVWQRLSQTGQAPGALSLAEYSAAEAREPESWALRGSGGNELGADVPPASRAWAKCGVVVGLSPREGESWVGLIRRMYTRPGGDLQADFAVLSRAPRAVSLREVLGKDEDSVFTNASSRAFAMSAVNAVILGDGANRAQPPSLLLAADHWKPGRIYELQEGSDVRYLRGVKVLRQGEDFVHTTFEWVAAPL